MAAWEYGRLEYDTSASEYDPMAAGWMHYTAHGKTLVGALNEDTYVVLDRLGKEGWIAEPILGTPGMIAYFFLRRAIA